MFNFDTLFVQKRTHKEGGWFIFRNTKWNADPPTREVGDTDFADLRRCLLLSGYFSGKCN